MAINFDITGTPPELADITAKREQAIIERAIFRKRNIRFMIGMATITITYVALMIIFVFPMFEKPETGIITYFFPHITFVIFIVGNHLHIKNIEKPSKALDKTIIALDSVTPDDINNTLEDKEHPAEIVSYLEKVAAQGRSLVQAEIDEIQKWHEEVKATN